MRISDWSSDVCSSDLVALVAAHEDAAQGSAIVKAFLDAQRHAVAQIGKFADLDRRAERARAQFELQPFIGIARDRLDEADDREIERRERSEEHTSELQSLMRISYAVSCLKNKTTNIK